MRYTTLKLLEIISAAFVIAVFIVVFMIIERTQEPPWASIAIWIGVMIAAITPLFIFERTANKNYPQWKNIWKMPKAVIGAFALLLIAMFVVAIFSDQSAGWMVLIIVLIRTWPEYYYARKYDMDNIQSIEELLQKHPEASAKLKLNIIL